MNQGDKIIFPVTYVLKIIFDTQILPLVHKEEMERMFLRIKVPFAFLSSKSSRKGNYVSYSVQVTLTDQAQMHMLYSDMKSLPGIKFAI